MRGMDMNTKVLQDIERFFFIYQNRNEDILTLLPTPIQEELSDELDLLKRSILNRIKEEFQH